MSEKKEVALNVQEVNDSSRSSLRSAKIQDNEPQFDEKRSKSLLWKMDRNIVPFLSLLYLLSFLVRVATLHLF